MRVYIIRHGESDNNAKKLWTGWLGVPLTEKGINDAQKAGEFLRGIEFDKVYSSDLRRAIETAGTALPEYAIETSPLLREINVGSIAGHPIDSIEPAARQKASEIGYALYGGESKAQLSDRIRTFKRELESAELGTVAVFCHAGWLRGFLDDVMGTVLPRGSVICSNCAIGVFEYEKGIWKMHSWINLT